MPHHVVCICVANCSLYSLLQALFDFLCRFDSPCYRGDVLKELCQTVQDILEVSIASIHLSIHLSFRQ